MRFTRPSVAGCAVLLSVAVAAPAHAGHTWGDYHWARTTNPFTLQLGDNVSSAWDGYLSTTSADWSVSEVLDTTIVPGTTTPKRCRPSWGRVEVCNAAYGRNGWLGLAQIWLSGSHVTQGAVKVNDTYFTMATYNTADWRNHVMCQEVGHTLGLGHTSEDGSSQDTCMDYSDSATSTHPNAHDYEQLKSIYHHTDTTTTVGTSSAAGAGAGAGAAIVTNDPSSWGREVARSGHHSTFVREVGAGRIVVTDVTWVE